VTTDRCGGQDDWGGHCFDHRFDDHGFGFDHRFDNHGFRFDHRFDNDHRFFNDGGFVIIVP
jgi:hypothetical protein